MPQTRYRVDLVTTVHPICDVRILYREERSLAAAGFDVEVIGPPPAPMLMLGLDDVRLTVVSRETSRLRSLLLAGPRLIPLLLQRQADVYHLHDPELLCIGLLLRLLGRHVVFDAHEDVSHQILDKGWISRPLRRPVAWLALCLAAFRSVFLELLGSHATQRAVVLFLGSMLVFLLGNALISGDINDNRIFFAFMGCALGWREMRSHARRTERASLGAKVKSCGARSNPVRVMHLSTAHPAMDTRILHRECRSLVGAGYDVTLVAQHSEDSMLYGVRILALKPRKNRIPRILLGSMKALFAVIRVRPRICHLHDPELIPLGLLLRVFGVHIVMDLHEDVPEQVMAKHWIPPSLRRPMSCTMRSVLRWLPRLFHGVVVATDYIATTLPTGRAIVVRNFPPRDAVALSREREREGPMRLVYVGGLSAERGVRELISAMRSLPTDCSVSLTLIGRTAPQDVEREVADAIQEMPDRIRHLGWLPPEQVWEHLAASEAGIVCLHPVFRYQVALPVKMFEYMAAGLSVIASNFELWRNIIEREGCGVCVNPLDVDAIAAAIEELASNPTRRAEMGRNSIRMVQSHYNWESESHRLLELYERITRS